jgi:N6-L-threonylcarbamoyladenine synthase
MLVLGIESSCDETAAAVVRDGRDILSNIVASQVEIHARYGGVVPEIASREHLRRVTPVVEEACRAAGINLHDVDALAVTEGPGLIGSLLVGVVYAKSVAFALGVPLVGVNHLEGHIQAVVLEHVATLAPGSQDQAAEDAGPRAEKATEARGPQASVLRTLFPNVTLVVSGGHTSLFNVDVSAEEAGAPAFTYVPLGRTRDDAAGEAFDKVAKLLALGYPGGPVIERLAKSGDPQAVNFGRVRMKGNPLDFSFSGLKTAVLYRVRGTEIEGEADARREWRKTARSVSTDELRAHCSQATVDLIASFQDAVVTDLVERTMLAAGRESSVLAWDDSAHGLTSDFVDFEPHEVETVFVSGGVACNSLLRERFAAAGRAQRLRVLFPSPKLSTDNAAMIAAAGYYRLIAGERADVRLTPHASFPLDTRAVESVSGR